MEQWNTRPPPLYLWSRPDWSAEHKTIAEKYGHISRPEEPLENIPPKSISADQPMGCPADYVDDAMVITNDISVQTDNLEGFKGGVGRIEGHKENSPKCSSDRAANESCGVGKKQSKKKLSNQRARKGKQKSEKGEIAAADKLKYGERSCGEVQRGMPPPRKVRENSHQHFETARGGSQDRRPDNMTRSYSMNIDDNYPSMTNRWSGNNSPASYYGVRNLEKQYMGSMRANRDSFGHRSPYSSEMEEMRRRDAQVQLHRQSLDTSVCDSLMGQDPRYGHIPPPLATTYRHVGLAAETPYGMNMNSSAMQRYAPRLDEPPPPMFCGNGFYDHRAPAPAPAPPGLRVGSIGFAPGPYQAPPGGSIGLAPGPYPIPPDGSMGYSSGHHQNLSHWNSGGWLNE